MEFISSDTNIWIDFYQIQQIELPFRLPYKYLMNEDAVQDELTNPPGLGEELISCGLIPTEITINEFFLAENYENAYKRLSIYDRIALAIAKERGIILLTGDGALRKAAQKENVSVMGTLGIFDKLWEQRLIGRRDYQCCLQQLLNKLGGVIRLPKNEIFLRLKRLTE